MPRAPHPTALLDLARPTAEAAAALIMQGLDRPRDISTKSSVTDLVTEMDEASERLIVETISAARPEDGFLGEEGTSVESTTGVRWVVDPIDGTTNYVYGYPGFAVSIAAEVDGEVTAGVVVDAMRNEVFTATAGGGAHRDGQPISVSDAVRLDESLVATGFWYSADVRLEQAKALAIVLPKIRDIRRQGAAAVDLCSVACGRVDGYYERGPNYWDYAAGALIAGEAGAITGGLHGGPVSPEFTFAAAPGIAAPLLELLRRAHP